MHNLRHCNIEMLQLVRSALVASLAGAVALAFLIRRRRSAVDSGRSAIDRSVKGEEIGSLAEPSGTIRTSSCGVRDLMSTFDRLLFEIDIGIPAEACANDLSSSKYQAPLEKVIAQVSEITGGLSYQYVQGTWTAEDSGEVHQEKDATLNLRIIILPEDREGMFDKIRDFITQAVRRDELPCNWIQVCETPLKQRFFEANPGYAWTPLKEVHATPAEIQRTKRKALARKMRSAVRAVNAAIKGNGPLTFKDFIRPVDHVRQLARSLGASPVLTVGEEQQQSGPHLLDNANATLVSCCGSFVQLMSEYGYVPLAAPVLDFSTLTGTAVKPSEPCLASPRSFSLFVTTKDNARVTSMQDVVDRKFKYVAINDCAASGAGALVAFAKQWDVPWKKYFYAAGGTADKDITCPRFVRPTGSHFDSLDAVLNGRIDVAIVDVIVLMHFKDEHPEEFHLLNVLSPPVGDFLFYPIWLHKSQQAKKALYLERLNQTPKDVLRAMYVKEFKPIELADFEGNPPIISEK